MRSWLIAASLAAATVAPELSAHEKFKIAGSVVAVKSDEVAVKAIDGATYEIDMLESTVVTDKNHKKLDRKELRAGLKVVVMALGHDMFDLEAFEVQLVDRKQSAAFCINSVRCDAFFVSSAAFRNSTFASANRFNLNKRSARTPGK